MKQQAKRLPPAQSSRLLKKALRAAFPATKFQVRLSSGTAYGNVHVSWTDGPTGDEVRTVSEVFRSEGFDGMTDSATHRHTSIELDGETYQSGLGLVLLHRDGHVA